MESRSRLEIREWSYDNLDLVSPGESKKNNSQSRLEKLHLFSRMRVRPRQSCLKALSVCFIKNLSKNKIYRVRVKKTKQNCRLRIPLAILCKQSDGHLNWQELVVGEMDNNVEVGKEGRKDEDGRRIFGKTKLKLQAALEMILGDMRVTSMMERSSIQIPDRYMINVRVYLRR